MTSGPDEWPTVEKLYSDRTKGSQLSLPLLKVRTFTQTMLTIRGNLAVDRVLKR